MPTNFLWGGAGVYGASVANFLSTELNSIATATFSTLGAAFQNTGGWIYADVELNLASVVIPAGSPYVELWLLRSLDAGTNYESSTPTRPADIIIPAIVGTAVLRLGAPGLILPPAFYKPIARNQLGVTMAASANTIRAAFYSESY